MQISLVDKHIAPFIDLHRIDVVQSFQHDIDHAAVSAHALYLGMHMHAVLADQDGSALSEALLDEMGGGDDLQFPLQPMRVHDLSDLYRFHVSASLPLSKKRMRPASFLICFKLDRHMAALIAGSDRHHLPDRACHDPPASDQTGNIIVVGIHIQQDLVLVETPHLLHGNRVLVVNDRSDQIKQHFLVIHLTWRSFLRADASVRLLLTECCELCQKAARRSSAI